MEYTLGVQTEERLDSGLTWCHEEKRLLCLAGCSFKRLMLPVEGKDEEKIMVGNVPKSNHKRFYLYLFL